jgi:hypothetical protein
MTVIQCITKRVSVTVSQHPESYLLEGIHTDSGCNQQTMAIKKQSWSSFGQMDIDKQISNNIGHFILYGLQLGFARSTTHI